MKHWPTLAEFLGGQEKQYIDQVLTTCKGDKTAAARVLGVGAVRREGFAEHGLGCAAGVEAHGHGEIATRRGDVLLAKRSGNVNVSTSHGDVNVHEVAGNVTVNMRGGDLRVSKISGDVSAEDFAAIRSQRTQARKDNDDAAEDRTRLTLQSAGDAA